MSRPPFALCYHGLGRPRPDGDPHGLLLDPSLFAAQLDDLQARGHRLVTASELWDGVRDGGGRDLGAITFDDGLADTMRTAVALLAERGARATLYVPTGLLGKPHPDLASGERILDRAGVARSPAPAWRSAPTPRPRRPADARRIPTRSDQLLPQRARALRTSSAARCAASPTPMAFGPEACARRRGRGYSTRPGPCR